MFDPHDLDIVIEGHTNTHIYYMFRFGIILGNHNDLHVKHEKTETAVRYRNKNPLINRLDHMPMQVSEDNRANG